MFVCDDPQFVFILIPKTATRSILAYCKTNFSQHGRHAGGHFTQNVPAPYKPHFTFCVGRDPYDRVCSAWWSTCKRGQDRYGLLATFKKRRMPNTLLSFLRLQAERLSYDAGQQARPKTVTGWPMIYWSNLFRIDHVLRFENLLEDFRALPFIPDDAELPRINTTVTDRPPTDELVGPEEGRLINKLYDQDFERFGYNKKNWT